MATAQIGIESDFPQGVAGGELIDNPASPRIPVVEVTGDDDRAGVSQQQSAEGGDLLPVTAAAQGEVDPVQTDHQQIFVGQGKSGDGDGFRGAQPGLRIGQCARHVRALTAANRDAALAAAAAKALGKIGVPASIPDARQIAQGFLQEL